MKQLESFKKSVKAQLNAILLSSYIMFGGDKPLPKPLVKPLYLVSMVGYNAFGVLSSLARVLKVLGLVRLTGLFVPFSLLVSATAFSYRVAYAALVVEVKHHKLAINV